MLGSDDNTIFPLQDQQAHGPILPNEPPLSVPSHRPKRTSKRSCAPILLLTLAVLAIGLFAGWQIGGHNIAENNLSPTIPAPRNSDTDKVREAVIAKVRPTVVQINVSSQGGSGLGSGVIIDKRGYIITNNHVVEGGSKIEVVLFDGTTLPAQQLGSAPDDDLAILKVDPTKTKLDIAALGDSSELQVGQEVLAIGNPLGITQTVTSGIISALGRNVATGPNTAILPSTIQTDAAINPGNSGGALVDLQGTLIGIPTLTAIDPQFKTPANGVGFAIPSNRVKFIAPQLITSGKVTRTGRAALEVQAADVDNTIASQNHLPVNRGVLIVSVTPNGSADKAGLRPDDIIVQIDNTAITGTLSLSDTLINKNPGDAVSIHLYRGNRPMTVKAILGELPAS